MSKRTTYIIKTIAFLATALLFVCAGELVDAAFGHNFLWWQSMVMSVAMMLIGVVRLGFIPNCKEDK